MAWQSSETSQSLAERAAGDGVELLPLGMLGMSSGHLVPTESSTGRSVCAASVPGASWSPGEPRLWPVHSVPGGQRSAIVDNSPGGMNYVCAQWIDIYSSVFDIYTGVHVQ